MSLFLNCQLLSKSYGSRLLFQNLSLSIFSGDRIGLIGPNGSGKSTLLKILTGGENPDSGTIATKRGLRVGYVPQSCEFPDEKPETILLKSLKLEQPAYEKERLVQTWLSKLGFSGEEASAERLSGGWKKRLSIAQELLSSPDLLLLDEPTNHLDLEGILWLEKFLSKEVPSFLLVSHDRYFLQNMVNRTIEMNPVYPDGLLSIDGPYAHFLEIKEGFIKGQIQQERSIASKARRELEWLRQSPKARTSKSKSRVGDAHEILEGLSQIEDRNRQKRADIDFSATERETRKLLVAKNLSKEAGDRTLFRHLDFTLSPGTRIGLMGPNGSGKTTLLRILAGEIPPDQGTLKKADALQIVYFDQHRVQLSHHITLREALCPHGDFVDFHGQKIHVNGWCKRFLFSPDILDMTLERLSGGERARISMAHLMLQPADLLLLDEPTNDLDIPTLETLEESLLDFPGAIVLITHDRCMMNRICNAFLALGDPDWNELYADYSQWEASLKTSPTQAKPKEKKPELVPTKAKLSYAEKKEYDQIEGNIGQLENEVRELNAMLEDAEICQSPDRLQTICNQIGLTEIQIEQLYLRWEELNKKQNS
jgi:ABC transport system ATP-binding/permease protein